MREVADKLNFEPHRLRLDQSGRYDETLDHEFPFLIKLFRFCHNDFTPIYSWHERLELFVPLDGTVSMLMGERQVDIGAGELLIVENMKLHRILDIAGLDTRVVVISFMSNLVYSLGSPSHDYFFLLPFYTNVGNRLHIVRDALLLADIHQIVSRLLRCYFERTTYFQIGCKAYFLELLYILAEFFRAADFRYSELIRQQERSAKLKPVLEFVDQHFAERITLKQAAALARMSVPQFIKLFKRVAGRRDLDRTGPSYSS